MTSKKLGVIVPYRNRPDQLHKFKVNISHYLRNAGIPFEIIVVNQDNAKLFNRGMLLNIGYRYAKKLNCDYLVFHDVDMIPIDVDYSYSEYPIHLAANFIDKKTKEKIKDIFDEYIGGVTIFPIEVFEKINGYSNKYWGWGYEDNDLLYRCIKNKIPLDHKIFKNYDTTGTKLKMNGHDAYIMGKNFNNLFDFNSPLTMFISFYPDEIKLDHTKEVDNFPIFCIPGFNTEILYSSFLRYSFVTFDSDKNVLHTSSNIKPNYKTTIAVSFNPKDKIVKIYQDGNILGKIEYENKLFNYAIEQFFYIGCGYNLEYRNIENYFKGYFDKFAVWSNILSDQQIYDISNSDEKNIKLTNEIGTYNNANDLKLYYDSNFIRDYKLVDLSGNKNDGEIFNCEMISIPLEESVKLSIPYRRNGTFYLLPHEENGYLNNKWKSQYTRYNQLRYHNEVMTNDSLMLKDGLSDLKYLEYGTETNKNITQVNVGL